MREDAPESQRFTQEEIKAIADFETVMKIATEAPENSELEDFALSRALELATSYNQIRKVAEMATPGSRQHKSAMKRSIDILNGDDSRILPIPPENLEDNSSDDD